MELVNARQSRAVLTAANEGAIISAVGRVLIRSRCLIQELWLSQTSVLEGLCDRQFYR